MRLSSDFVPVASPPHSWRWQASFVGDPYEILETQVPPFSVHAYVDPNPRSTKFMLVFQVDVARLHSEDRDLSFFLEDYSNQSEMFNDVLQSLVGPIPVMFELEQRFKLLKEWVNANTP